MDDPVEAEVSQPALLPDGTIGALVVPALEAAPEAALIGIPDAFGGWFDLTAGEFLHRARSLASGFMAAGLQAGDVIAVLSTSRFEVALVDLAAALAGAVVLPLSPLDGPTELLAVLEETRARAVVVETVRDFARFDEIHGDLPLVAEAWQIGLGDLDKLAELGAGISAQELAARAAAVDPAAVAALMADSAGVVVELTHADLVSRAVELGLALAGSGALDGEDAAVLQILPGTDAFARVTTLLALSTGSRLGHLADPARLIESLASFRPTLLVARPATYEAVEEATLARAEQTSRGPALKQALEVAVEHSAALEAGTVPRGLKTRFALADALVLRGLRKAVGGRVRVVVSLADEESLPLRLRHLMRALDVRPLEALGGVRTTGPALVERYDDAFERPVGGVGAPLAGVEVAVGPDGGIGLRGAGVVPPDGADWLDTGLVGEVEGGRVFLADR